MNKEELSAMKYGDLLKLAKEKLNITRRFSKEKLIERLLQVHQNFLSDSNFISADESTGNLTVEVEEPVQTRGKKRGNQSSEEKKKQSKPAKKAKKESIEHTLNSTFSVDEDEEELGKNPKDLPVVVTKPKKYSQRKLRGAQKRSPTAVKQSPTTETEADKTPIVEPKTSAKTKPNTDKPPPKNAKKQRVSLQSSELSEDISINEPVPQKVETEPPADIPTKTVLKPTRATLKRSSQSPAAQQMPDRVSVKRTRSSGKSEPADHTLTKESPVKKLKRSLSSGPSASPQVEPTIAPTPTTVEKKTALRRTSTHPLRNAKTMNTPARAAMTPVVASAKKGVQFTANSSTQIPKAKPKAAPNFAEIHQKNFLKMQSVDEYVEKKRARTETMTASAKTVRTKSVLTNNIVTPQSKPPAVVKKAPTPEPKAMKFNFVSGLQKPVFTAKGQVVNEKQRVIATVKENLHNSSSHIPVMTTAAAAKGKRQSSTLDLSRDINASKLSLAGKQMLKGVRTNRRFELQMQHRNMKN